jgi:hypothetical protein
VSINSRDRGVAVPYEDREYESEAVSEAPPLLMGLERMFKRLSDLEKTVEIFYERLEHLTYNTPDIQIAIDDGATSPARAASDTVNKLESASDRVAGSTARLNRLLRILEA